MPAQRPAQRPTQPRQHSSNDNMERVMAMLESMKARIDQQEQDNSNLREELNMLRLERQEEQQQHKPYKRVRRLPISNSGVRRGITVSVNCAYSLMNQLMFLLVHSLEQREKLHGDGVQMECVWLSPWGSPKQRNPW